MKGVGGSRICRRVALASAAVVVVATVVATASAADQARWIVFSATSPGSITAQLFRIRSSGGTAEQITKGSYSSLAPVFSPNGKQLVFARTGVGILSMNLDGTGVRRLTTNGRDSYPTFSPDGKQVTFVRPYKAGWTLFVMSSSGDGEHRLAKAPPSGRPTWTAGGILIPSGGDLLKLDPATGHVLKYYDATIDAVWGMNSVALSPDRSTITFVGSRNPEPGDKECGEGPCQRFALYEESVVPKAKKPVRVVKDVGPATFSPNGKQLAFVSGGGLVLWTRASGVSTPVSTGDAYPTVSAPPAWQP